MTYNKLQYIDIFNDNFTELQHYAIVLINILCNLSYPNNVIKYKKMSFKNLTTNPMQSGLLIVESDKVVGIIGNANLLHICEHTRF